MAMRKRLLNVLSLGLACGITFAMGFFLLGTTAWLFNWGNELVRVISSMYIGYSPSFLGSIIGAVWGFFDGFIMAVLIAFLYNTYSGDSPEE